jgi:hypothetical protein
MTTNIARCAFLRSYHLPAILQHYPRLVRAMQGIAMLNGMDAAGAFETSRRAAAGAVKPSANIPRSISRGSRRLEAHGFAIFPCVSRNLVSSSVTIASKGNEG